MKSLSRLLLVICFYVCNDSFAQNWNRTGSFDSTIIFINNKGGKKIAYSTQSGIRLLTVNGFGFKDLNKNGKLDAYEDWRLSPIQRAADLAAQLSIEQIAGLMLYSRHQPIPAGTTGFFAGTYKGKPFPESGALASDLSDQQIKFLTNDNLRHILVTSVKSPAVAAQWTNNVQALVEGIGMGIPVNNSSDPRHGTRADAEFNAGSGGAISMWPGSLGLAATFNPELVTQFGKTAAAEYRALGLTTALSPQVDLATDPRWSRVSGTFGEDTRLSTDIGRAYIDGFQTSFGHQEILNGWGFGSVNAMVKHWPGGGTGEGGRDAHYGFGKYAVYPGNNFNEHLVPFTAGAFKLKGKTRMASAVMPYYTISVDQDIENKENVGNAYNAYIIGLLRKKYKYEGVLCTDWGVTGDETALDVFVGGKPWGLEKLTVAERHLRVLMAGIDQFGGNNDMAPVIEAYKMGVGKYGEKVMRERFELSARRLLLNFFRLGLFENPYLDPAVSAKEVGKSEYMQAGFNAQLRSVVMLKNNKQALPLSKNKKVYIPKKFTPKGRNFLGIETPEKLDYPVNIKMVGKYFTVTDNPDEADYALVFINSPNSGTGYNSEEAKAGGTGYVPISLQFGEYKAETARENSLAGGDPLEKFTNRSYRSKTISAINISDLNMVNDTYSKMKGKPVIVSVNVSNPMVFGEFEKNANAILVHFGVQDQALLEIITGVHEPSALLPFQMPIDMLAVEQQKEDVAHDMVSYKDADGHVYKFGFGMNWKGVINDARTKHYVKPASK